MGLVYTAHFLHISKDCIVSFTALPEHFIYQCLLLMLLVVNTVTG